MGLTAQGLERETSPLKCLRGPFFPSAILGLLAQITGLTIVVADTRRRFSESSRSLIVYMENTEISGAVWENLILSILSSIGDGFCDK
jgi:hypothetical protein